MLQVLVAGAQRDGVLAQLVGEAVLQLVDVLVQLVELREALGARREPGVGRAELAGPSPG